MLSTASSLKPPALLLAEFFTGLFSDLGGRGKKTIRWGFGNVNYPGIQVLVTGISHGWGVGPRPSVSPPEYPWNQSWL